MARKFLRELNKYLRFDFIYEFRMILVGLKKGERDLLLEDFDKEYYD